MTRQQLTNPFWLLPLWLLRTILFSPVITVTTRCTWPIPSPVSARLPTGIIGTGVGTAGGEAAAIVSCS
jgi:hypothetical protein